MVKEKNLVKNIEGEELVLTSMRLPKVYRDEAKKFAKDNGMSLNGFHIVAGKAFMTKRKNKE